MKIYGLAGDIYKLTSKCSVYVVSKKYLRTGNMTSALTASACTGICTGFENNGVCDVPLICVNGTDCFDCQSIVEIWSITGIIVSVAFIAVAIYIVVLQRRQRQKNKDSDQEQMFYDGAGAH